MNSGSEPGTTPAQQLRPARSRPAESAAQLVAWAGCILGLIFAADICLLMLTGAGSERRDFVSYWASGQQLIHRQNPYDAVAIAHLEHALGFPMESDALIVRNPPFALVLVAPLGLVGFRTGSLLWSLLLLVCWAISVGSLRAMQAGAVPRFRVFGYPFSAEWPVLLFAPALACMFFGQTALVALLGFVLFLRWHRSRPLLAGISLWLCAVKPHLLLPFALVLVLWIAVTRSYAVFAGAVIALGASSVLVFRIDPQVWTQYAQMMRTAGLEREFIPCLGIALRFALDRGAAWLQYVPAVIGAAWAAWYYLSRRAAWDWREHGPLLVLVSVVASPYAWLTDEALAMPALFLAANRSSLQSLATPVLASAAIEAAILASISLHSAFYLWTAPAWLFWFLYAMHSRARDDSAA